MGTNRFCWELMDSLQDRWGWIPSCLFSILKLPLHLGVMSSTQGCCEFPWFQKVLPTLREEFPYSWEELLWVPVNLVHWKIKDGELGKAESFSCKVSDGMMCLCLLVTRREVLWCMHWLLWNGLLSDPKLVVSCVAAKISSRQRLSAILYRSWLLATRYIDLSSTAQGSTVLHWCFLSLQLLACVFGVRVCLKEQICLRSMSKSIGIVMKTLFSEAELESVTCLRWWTHWTRSVS